MWLLLAGFSAGQFLVAAAVSLGAVRAFARLGEPSPRIGRWAAVFELFGVVFADVVRSNFAVARLLLIGGRRKRVSGFVTIPLRIRHPLALATLSIIVTSTPGTAWVDYSSTRRTLLIHVFDLVDEQGWIDLITNRYEARLMEIFE